MRKASALGATHNGIKSLICLPYLGAADIKKSKPPWAAMEQRYACAVHGVYDDAYSKSHGAAKEWMATHSYIHSTTLQRVPEQGQGTIGLEDSQRCPMYKEQ